MGGPGPTGDRAVDGHIWEGAYSTGEATNPFTPVTFHIFNDRPAVGLYGGQNENIIFPPCATPQKLAGDSSAQSNQAGYRFNFNTLDKESGTYIATSVSLSLDGMPMHQNLIFRKQLDGSLIVKAIDGQGKELMQELYTLRRVGKADIVCLCIPCKTM